MPSNPLVVAYWQGILGGNETAQSPVQGPLYPGVCSQCGGMGFYRLNVPVGHPQFGKLQPCDCMQVQWETKRQAKMQHIADLPRDTERMTFANFERDLDADTQRAYDAAWDFVYGEEPPIFLFFTGDTGGGKTRPSYYPN